MLKLSIIIPVYNLESYIERCIISLVHQDIPKETYEIIVVNDGSSDKTRDIIVELIQKHSNIILIDKVNGGVSTARNTGLEIAKGKYIMFVDGDDYIVENTLGFLLQYIETNKLHLGLFSYQTDGENIKPKLTTELATVITGMELYNNHRTKSIDSSCVLLFQNEFLRVNQIKYTVGVPFLEDGEFLARVMCLAELTAFYDFPYYVRVKRPGSATTSNLYHSKKAIDGFITAAINLKDFQNNANLTDEQKKFLNQPIIKFVVTAASACRSLPTIWYLNYVRKQFKYHLDCLALEASNSEHIKFGKWYNQSIYYYFIRRNLENYQIFLQNKFRLLSQKRINKLFVKSKRKIKYS